MSEAPFVSVVVPHYNDLKGLDLCLAALMQQSYPRSRFEVIVADNASPVARSDLERAVAGRAKLVLVEQKGAGPARNGGAAEAAGEVLAFTDADCRPEPDWLSEGVAALAAYDFVGGAMAVLVEDPSAMTPAEAFEAVFAFDNQRYVLRKGFTVTANLLCGKAVFEAVGGFRVGVSEDLEWSMRATAAGFRIGYARHAVVQHPARRTWPELKAKWKRLNAETFALYSGRRGGRLMWLLKSLALPASAVAHAPKVLMSTELAGLRQRLQALAMLGRLRLWRTADGLSLLGQGS